MTEYIEREAAIAVIEEKQKELCPVGMYSRHAVYGSDREKFDAWQDIIDILEAIPAADVAPVKRGYWRMNKYDAFNVHCSLCSCTCGTFWNYCPNCGAKMKDGDGDV